MIRIYLDWNVMTQLKGGHLEDLLAILSQSNRFFVPYSTSHIGDILTSYNEEDQAQKQIIEKDLDFIAALTQNYCLSNNGKQVVLDTNSVHSEELQLTFIGSTAMDYYLNEIMRSLDQSKANKTIGLTDSVEVQLVDYSLLVNHDTTETLWNTFYTRQLDLNLQFVMDSDTIAWRGKISDKISKEELKLN